MLAVQVLRPVTQGRCLHTLPISAAETGADRHNIEYTGK